MKFQPFRMPILRLAYTTQFLIALFTIFEVWSQVGGQSHLDLMPWYLKLGLAGGAAFATVRATICAVSQEKPWNVGTFRWLVVLLVLLALCGASSYYVHLYGEQPEDEDQSVTSFLKAPLGSQSI
jgi:glucan phosphoethanolaminetransferase (alkaline phosphatase superfamily)